MSIEQQLNIPSPIHTVSTSWTDVYGITLSIKRDDLIHPIISGNKWRKLSGIFREFAEESYSEVVTYGGAFSNHLVATAASCAILGKKSTGIIRGEEPKVQNAVLKLCKLYGMHLQFVTRTEYKEVNRTYGIQDDKLYVPEGGACQAGTMGCKNIITELVTAKYDKIMVACGTGTTLAGMAEHLQALHQLSKLVGVQVLKGKDYIKHEVENTYGIQGVNVLDDFHGGGYAKMNTELVHFIKDFNRETGVLLDPIYTGKLLLTIQKCCENGTIARGERVLAIHTGGLTGWFGKWEELDL